MPDCLSRCFGRIVRGILRNSKRFFPTKCSARNPVRRPNGIPPEVGGMQRTHFAADGTGAQLQLKPIRSSTKSKRPLQQRGGVSLSCPEPRFSLEKQAFAGQAGPRTETVRYFAVGGTTAHLEVNPLRTMLRTMKWSRTGGF
jgi:hypothetical protein